MTLTRDEDPSDGPERKSYRIEAVARALSVLETLGERPDQTLTALASDLGMTKSIVFRLLQTLEERGFVQRDSQRATFALGYRMSVLGERVGRNGALLQVAPAIMDALRDKTGENVNLIVREGLHALALATREGFHSIRIFAQSGRRGPLYAGGGSTLLLAFADPAVQERVLAGPLETFTPHTVTHPDKLREILQRIHTKGYHVALNDLDDGAFSVAAPIRGVGGDVIASLSLAGASVRLDEARRDSYIEEVLKSAAEISAKMCFA
ncbi:MAG: IclR family transcriptional regulator [Rhodobacteraceae bacterium]|jgi:IclR family KDG regulon transcriptional repressor|nr:IclR family transcriptional regulator [Paracoccaceae bacterium]